MIGAPTRIPGSAGAVAGVGRIHEHGEFVDQFGACVCDGAQLRLPDCFATLRKRLSPQAAVWVSWPKKSSKVATDITEDTIRDLALPLGFVDIKVCAVTEVWSGLKLVVRKELRAQS